MVLFKGSSLVFWNFHLCQAQVNKHMVQISCLSVPISPGSRLYERWVVSTSCQQCWHWTLKSRRTMAVGLLNLIWQALKPSKSRHKGDVKSMMTIIKKEFARRCKSQSILSVQRKLAHWWPIWFCIPGEMEVSYEHIVLAGHFPRKWSKAVFLHMRSYSVAVWSWVMAMKNRSMKFIRRKSTMDKNGTSSSVTTGRWKGGRSS